MSGLTLRPNRSEGGTTSFGNYDALNRRITHVVGNDYQRYEYGVDGRLAGVWQGEEIYENLARYYGPRSD